MRTWYIYLCARPHDGYKKWIRHGACSWVRQIPTNTYSAVRCRGDELAASASNLGVCLVGTCPFQSTTVLVFPVIWHLDHFSHLFYQPYLRKHLRFSSWLTYHIYSMCKQTFEKKRQRRHSETIPKTALFLPKTDPTFLALISLEMFQSCKYKN